MNRDAINPYRIVWTIVMFDLPVGTPEARRAYTEFRDMLLENGFTMMQFSIYARSCLTEEKAETYVLRIRRALPPDGEVRILQITDKQLSRMQVFLGPIPKPPEKPSEQLEFF